MKYTHSILTYLLTYFNSSSDIDGNGLCHRYGRNGEFCVTVALILGLLAYWPSRLKALVAMGPAIRLTCVRRYASLGLAVAGLKGSQQRTSFMRTNRLFLLLQR